MPDFRSYLEKPLVRYIAIGALSYAIELAVIYLLIALTHSAVLSAALAFWVGLVVSFLLQKLLAFKNTERSRRAIAHQTLAYGLLVLVNYIFTLLVIHFFTDIFGILATRTSTLIITTIWNYFIYRRIIFKK